jgi:hypothetical protein
MEFKKQKIVFKQKKKFVKLFLRATPHVHQPVEEIPGQKLSSSYCLISSKHNKQAITGSARKEQG